VIRQCGTLDEKVALLTSHALQPSRRLQLRERKSVARMLRGLPSEASRRLLPTMWAATHNQEPPSCAFNDGHLRRSADHL
jgi:hypothetical protein